MRSLTVLFVASIVLSAGCSDSKTPATPSPSGEAKPVTSTTPKATQPSTPQPPTTAAKGAISFADLAPSMVPAAIRTQGSVERAIEWTDKNGRNIVTFAAREKMTDGHLTDRWLYINHDVVSGDGSRRLRSVKDGVKSCEFDVHAQMVGAALGVTDLDGDEIAELTFAYLTTCTSDVSPMTLKLLLLEDGAKYIIRGTNQIRMGEGGPTEGGDKRVDPAVSQGPAAFGRHLDAVWARIVGPWSPQGQLLAK